MRTEICHEVMPIPPNATSKPTMPSLGVEPPAVAHGHTVHESVQSHPGQIIGRPPPRMLVVHSVKDIVRQYHEHLDRPKQQCRIARQV